MEKPIRIFEIKCIMSKRKKGQVEYYSKGKCIIKENIFSFGQDTGKETIIEINKVSDLIKCELLKKGKYHSGGFIIPYNVSEWTYRKKEIIEIYKQINQKQ